MNILVPQGIGDSIWAMHKVQSLARQSDRRINILIACFGKHMLEARALDFIQRFRFVDHVEMYMVPHIGQKGAVLCVGEPADENGYYRYLPDGRPSDPKTLPNVDYVMMPNAPLERGIRLEDWLPELETNWNIMDDFQFTVGENTRADAFRQEGEFVTFFLGSEASNTTAGHNRGGIWTPEDWIQLGQSIKERYGVRIAVVGATYDRDYYDKHIRAHVDWVDLIGRLGIAETFAFTKRSRFIVSYQSGIGIVTSYFKVPTAIFWRAKGDSVISEYYVTFEEAMSSAWANPQLIAENKHLPLIYGRHDRQYLLDQIEEKKW